MNQPKRVINADVHFHGEMPLIAFFFCCISGSRSPLLILVDMMAASTMMPSRSIRPFFSRCLFFDEQHFAKARGFISQAGNALIRVYDLIRIEFDILYFSFFFHKLFLRGG